MPQEQVNGIAQDSANKAIAIAQLQAQLGSPPGAAAAALAGSLEARVAMLEQALRNQTEINRVLTGTSTSTLLTNHEPLVCRVANTARALGMLSPAITRPPTCRGVAMVAAMVMAPTP